MGITENVPVSRPGNRWQRKANPGPARHILPPSANRACSTGSGRKATPWGLLPTVTKWLSAALPPSGDRHQTGFRPPPAPRPPLANGGIRLGTVNKRVFRHGRGGRQQTVPAPAAPPLPNGISCRGRPDCLCRLARGLLRLSQGLLSVAGVARPMRAVRTGYNGGGQRRRNRPHASGGPGR